MIPKISLNAQLLYNRLAQAQVDEVVTYDELSGLVGRDVRTKGSNALGTARRRALVNGMVFEAISGTGLQRMNDTRIVDVSVSDLKAVRRKVRRSAQKLTRVDYQKLSKEKQVLHNTNLSLFGTLEMFSGTPAVAHATKKVLETQETIPVGRMLDLFK